MREDIEGQLVAYAASPGQLAMDGNPGENSPFTKALLKLLQDPGVPFSTALTHAAKLVFEETQRTQRPFLATDMGGDIYLRRQPTSRKRKALVFSVDTGPGTHTLVNVERDAKAWEALFRDTGFEVTRLINPSRPEILTALSNLRFERERKQGARQLQHVHRVAIVPKTAAPANTLAAIFFSGTGFAKNNENYLAAVGTRIGNIEELAATAVGVTEIQKTLSENAASSLLVLDTNFNLI